MAKPKVQPFFDARGRLLLERRGLRRELGSTLANDAYHFLRTTTWWRITLLFAAMFAGLNALFALLYWWDGSVANTNGYLDCYWFSVQTIATIGYGGMTPASTFANVIVAVESFIGIGFTALATGVFFARFATPSARVIFSNVAIICDYEGTRTLMFRLANARATAITEATIRLYLSRDEVTAAGERVRRIHDLAVRRNVSPVFALSWTVYHPLDTASPLHGLTTETMNETDWNLIVTFQGIDDRLAATVHTRWHYDASEIEFDHRFVDIIKRDPDGTRYLDFTDFHATEPLTSSRAA